MMATPDDLIRRHRDCALVIFTLARPPRRGYVMTVTAPGDAVAIVECPTLAMAKQLAREAQADARRRGLPFRCYSVVELGLPDEVKLDGPTSKQVN